MYKVELEIYTSVIHSTSDREKNLKTFLNLFNYKSRKVLLKISTDVFPLTNICFPAAEIMFTYKKYIFLA